MLATGGGVTPDGSAWKEAPHDYLVPVKKLSPMISQRFAEELEKHHPDLHALIPKKTWKREWCSFVKPFGTGKNAVLRYLARYVFRVAISNTRILSMDESHVTFRHKDNDTGSWETERVTGVDFLRRFLMHVLPKGFHKVRYYGLWAPVKRDLQAMARILLTLNKPITQEVVLIPDLANEVVDLENAEEHELRVRCPSCNGTNVVLIKELERGGSFMVT